MNSEALKFEQWQWNTILQNTPKNIDNASREELLKMAFFIEMFATKRIKEIDEEMSATV